MPTRAMRAVAPSDDMVDDHAARVDYDQKQRDEPIPFCNVQKLVFGDANHGCASIATEVYRAKEHVFRYCRSPRRCKAELSAARKRDREKPRSEAENS